MKPRLHIGVHTLRVVYAYASARTAPWYVPRREVVHLAPGRLRAGPRHRVGVG